VNAREQERLYREAVKTARPATVEVPARRLARDVDVETSHLAAAANAVGKCTNRRICLDAHRNAIAGLTDDEVRTITNLPDVEANRRCTDLRNLGLIRWMLVDGEPVHRPTRRGRPARVSVITEAGISAVRS
jgi:hypothetical protein